MHSKDLIDQINAARMEILDLIEAVSESGGLLREAEADERHGNRQGARLCIDDAVHLLSTVESKSAALAAKLATIHETSVSNAA